MMCLGFEARVFATQIQDPAPRLSIASTIVLLVHLCQPSQSSLTSLLSIVRYLVTRKSWCRDRCNHY
jgi:hypothetical protein